MKVDDSTRLEALHLHGTDSMKTEDIFALFSGFNPASVEWLSDKTCNVVWLDKESCANALLNCSTRIRGQYPDESDDSEEEESVSIGDIRCALPPGGIWRRSHATQLAPNLFVRFAKYSDRRGYKQNQFLHNGLPRKNFVFLDEGDEVAKKFRPDTGNPWSDLAREWSYYEMRSAAKKHDDRLPGIKDARELIRRVPRIPDVTASISTGSKTRRSYDDNNIDFDDKSDEDEVDSRRIINDRSDRSLIGRGMQADIEEKKILSKKLKMRYKHQSPSSIDLRERLSTKRKLPTYDDGYSDEEISDKFKHCKHKRLKSKRSEEIWIRHESEDSEIEDEPVQSYSSSSNEDLRRKLRKHSESKDEKSSRKGGSSVLTINTKKFIPDTPLQIEIDNDIYFERVNRDN
ncbi:hypothetical protein O3M35_010448 [Rhynocoris fuscipes]